MATTKTAEHSRSKAGPPKNGGDWLHVDDYPIPDSNAGYLDLELSALFSIDASDSLYYGYTPP